MHFQTVFISTKDNSIIKVLPNQYIRNKFEKIRFCPGYEHGEINFFYFKSTLPIVPVKHKIVITSPTSPPFIIDEDGMPLIYFAAKEPFMEAIKSFKNIIVNFADSMGDNLYRAACVLEAQKVYPQINFLCKVEDQYKPIISLIPGLTIFKDYKTHDVLSKDCTTVEMSAKLLLDPLGNYFSAPSRYGLYLGLKSVPYDLRLDLPADMDTRSDAIMSLHHIANADKLIIMQLRTKGDESRSWSKEYIFNLARLIKKDHNCQIVYLGAPSDLPTEHPDIINLSGKVTWLETLYLLHCASQIICIDSAVLHLSRAIGKTPITLYGHTDPRGVLGLPPTKFDLGASATDRRSAAEKIKPLDVMAVAFNPPCGSASTVINISADVSQHGEKEIINKYFEDHPPKYKQVVDVGAFGKQLSNSFSLLQDGWKGLLVEAYPARIPIIKKEFSGLDFIILPLGVGLQKGKLPFFIHTVPEHNSFRQDWYPDTLTSKKRFIDVLPLPDILSAYNVPLDFDFLTIDTEGLDKVILFDLLLKTEFRPGLIITECTSYADDFSAFTTTGYKQIGFIGEPGLGNAIFGRDA